MTRVTLPCVTLGIEMTTALSRSRQKSPLDELVPDGLGDLSDEQTAIPRIARDLLGLGEDALASVARLRTLLASDPSIHGSKKPELSS